MGCLARSLVLLVVAGLAACDVPASAYAYTDAGSPGTGDDAASMSTATSESDPSTSTQQHDEGSSSTGTGAIEATATTIETSTETTTDTGDGTASATETAEETSTATDGSQPAPAATVRDALLLQGAPGHGEQLFDQHCTRCHDASNATDFKRRTRLRVAGMIVNGGGRMPSFAQTLTSQDVADILAWIYQ